MEAKDTVMSNEEMDTAYMRGSGKAVWDAVKEVAQAQAEISFKMGYNQALKDIRDGLLPSDMV